MRPTPLHASSPGAVGRAPRGDIGERPVVGDDVGRHLALGGLGASPGAQLVEQVEVHVGRGDGAGDPAGAARLAVRGAARARARRQQQRVAALGRGEPLAGHGGADRGAHLRRPQAARDAEQRVLAVPVAVRVEPAGDAVEPGPADGRLRGARRSRPPRRSARRARAAGRGAARRTAARGRRSSGRAGAPASRSPKYRSRRSRRHASAVGVALDRLELLPPHALDGAGALLDCQPPLVAEPAQVEPAA